MITATTRWIFMVIHEARVALANPGVSLACAALASVPVFAAIIAPTDAAERASVIFGLTGAAIGIGLPSLACLLGSGILRSRLASQELAKGVSRLAFTTARLAGVLAVIAVAAIGILVTTFFLSGDTALREYQRPEAGSLVANGSYQALDGRWWLVGAGEQTPSIEFDIALPNHTADSNQSDAAMVEMRVIRGIARPGSNVATGDLPSHHDLDDDQRAIAANALVVASFRDAKSSGATWITPTDQLISSSRLLLPVAANSTPSGVVRVRILRGQGEFLPGIHLAEVRLAVGSKSPTPSFMALVIGAMAASLCIAAVGVAFGAPFSRATALLAGLCVLVAGWLAPDLSLGQRPRLFRNFESALHSSADGRESKVEPVESASIAPWWPHLALPSTRDQMSSGEVVRVGDVLDEVKWTGAMAGVLILLGWGLLRWREWEDAVADS